MLHGRRLLVSFFIVLAAVSLPTISRAQKPALLVLQGGTLIDATGRPPIEDAVIVIEGERIKAVGKRGDVTVPRGARVIDVKGKTVLPGFIDGHCHLLDFVGEIYLHLGITACPDITQNDDEWTMAQRDGTQLGKIRGPAHLVHRLAARRSAARVGAARRARPSDQDAGRGAAPSCGRKKRWASRSSSSTSTSRQKRSKPAPTKPSDLGLPVTCHCLDVFLAAEAGFAGVEHHWGLGMTSIGDVKKRWEIHERRMTRKINTADLSFYYEPENFDKIVQAMVEKNVSWSPTIATWYRPLSPSVERFKERELSILDKKSAKLSSGRLARASPRPI